MVRPKQTNKVSSPTHQGGKASREFCIFFKLSLTGVSARGLREVADEAVPAAGRVTVKED